MVDEIPTYYGIILKPIHSCQISTLFEFLKSTFAFKHGLSAAVCVNANPWIRI
jgi:hypothetical protein